MKYIYKIILNKIIEKYNKKNLSKMILSFTMIIKGYNQ